MPKFPENCGVSVEVEREQGEAAAEILIFVAIFTQLLRRLRGGAK